MKFAAYHFPMFPMHHYAKEDFVYSEEMIHNWGSAFDANNLSTFSVQFDIDLLTSSPAIGFEFHVHGYKRTLPLRKGKPSVVGTVYLGDGCMGASETKYIDPELEYIGALLP